MTDIPQTPPDSEPDTGRLETITVSYRPKPGLGLLCLQVFFFKMITLGIYGFWGKTEVRQHIWSCVHISDEPLEYTGTGKELFLGFLIVIGIVVIPLTALQVGIQVMFVDNIGLNLAVTYLVAVLFIYLIGVATYRARRYRLSRTLWRGIRGTLTGSPWRFGWSSFWMTLTLPFTLFWTFPWMRLRLNSIMTNEMEFGSAPFTFAGSSRPLYRRFAIMWAAYLVVILCFPIVFALLGAEFNLMERLDSIEDLDPPSQNVLIGTMVAAFFVIIPAFLVLSAVLRAYYVSAELRYFAQCTGFQNAKFEMNATTGSLIWLAVGNFLILLFTLGIGAPIMQQRLVRYICDRITVIGPVDVAAIQQSQAELDRRGEGMAEVFDIDAF